MSFITLDYETAFRSRKNKGTEGPSYSLKHWTYEEYLRGSKYAKTHGLVEVPFRAHGVGVKVDRAPAEWVSHDDLPYFLKEMFPENNDHTVLAHNTMFDGAIMGWVHGVHANKYYDTRGMSAALWNQRSSSLDALAKRCFPEDSTMWKRKEDLDVSDGIWHLNEEQEQIISDYCLQDVEITFGCFEKMWQMGFPQEELEVMDMTLKMFIHRPFVLDRERLEKYQRRLQRNRQRWYRISGWAESTLSSNDKFVAQLEKKHDIKIEKIPSPTQKNPDNMKYPLAKDDLEFLALQDKHPELKAVWKARIAAKANSEISRCARVLDHGSVSHINPHGNIAMPLNYHAAHTGRWGGTNKQNPQNLGRGSILRKALKAPEGYLVAVRDLSNIEGRMNAWFCQQDDLLEALAGGVDIYNDMATDIYGYPVNRKEPRFAVEGFVGKVACLSGNTLVLTNNGIKTLENISIADSVWDGEKWVTHQGLIYQGEKNTITLQGVNLTPDHKILCGTQWKDAKYLALDENILSQALDTAAENLPLQGTSRVNEEVYRPLWLYAPVAQTKNIQYLQQTLNALNPHDATVAPKKQQEKNATGNTLKQCQTMSTVPAYLTGCPPQYPDAINRQTDPMKITGQGVYRSTTSGEKIDQTSLNTSKRLKGGMTQNWKWIEKTTVKDTNQTTFDLLPDNKTPITKEGYAIKKKESGNLKQGSFNWKQKMPVYDLLNAGPKNRFTILTNKGPLIVHNCLGLGYNMGANKFHHTLASGAMGKRVDIGLAAATNVVQTYRRKNWKITLMWKRLQGVIFDMANPNMEPYMLGPVRIEYRRIVLPNGLALNYPGLREIEHPEAFNEYEYWEGKFWKKIYGGLLLENIIQALSRIIMSEAMVRFKRWLGSKGQIALTVHDEVVVIVKEDHAEAAYAQLDTEMSKIPDWCDSRLTLETDGGIDHCYSK